jgi:hypothetical protein
MNPKPFSVLNLTDRNGYVSIDHHHEERNLTQQPSDYSPFHSSSFHLGHKEDRRRRTREAIIHSERRSYAEQGDELNK